MSAHNVNLCLVLSDTRRIIKANRGHFLALSLLFVLPLSFSSIVYPSLSNPTSIISSYSRFFSSSAPVTKDERPPVDKSDIIFSVIYSLFELLFSFCTTASITRSISNGFFGEPLKFTSSLKSILLSFLPLTATYIVSRLILGLIFFVVLFFSGLMYGGILFSRAETAVGGDVYLMGVFVVLITVLLIGVMIYFQLEWYLADVIVVVESEWGYAPLRRSSYLVKGMKWVAFSILICFSLLFGITSAIFSSSVHSPINSGSISWMFVLHTVVFTGITAILKLYSVSATAVLFIYCKGLRGESATEIVDEFAPSYVRSPYDGDEKAPKIVGYV